RAGPGQERRPADEMARGAGRGRRSQDQGELVQEVRVGPAEAEGDRARRVIGDDPRVQVAPPRVPVARLCAEDALVVGGDSAEAELPLEYRMPRRSVNVYAVPPPAGRGSVTARSGTSVPPSAPSVLRNATSPS